MSNDVFSDFDFDKAMKPIKRFRAIGDSFKQKENLKAWGWFWNPEERQWEIEAKNIEQPEVRALRRFGLEYKEIK